MSELRLYRLNNYRKKNYETRIFDKHVAFLYQKSEKLVKNRPLYNFRQFRSPIRKFSNRVSKTRTCPKKFFYLKGSDFWNVCFALFCIEYELHKGVPQGNRHTKYCSIFYIHTKTIRI